MDNVMYFDILFQKFIVFINKIYNTFENSPLKEFYF